MCLVLMSWLSRTLVTAMNLDDIFTVNHKEVLDKKLKVYIYDLPSSMNHDIVQHAIKHYGYRNCMSLNNAGMGDELFTLGENDELSIRNTDQFALEVIIHNKLLKSSFRTLDPDEADIFYIPAYVGTHCVYHNNYYFTSKSEQLILNLTDFLQSQKYFRQGKPHFSTISHIHREMALHFCPYLTYNITHNITFLAIEKWSKPNDEAIMKSAAQSINVIPYPSFVHLVTENLSEKLPIPDLDHRDVFLFFPAGLMCSNDLRCKIMEQFNLRTTLSYEEFKNQRLSTDMVLFQVSTCDNNTDRNLVPWMQHSVFCLQPPGDSPTRKSFYDSLMSGCIPVIFGNHSVHYAFSSYLDFSKFTVSMPTDIVYDSNNGIYEFLRNIDRETIVQLHTSLLKIVKYMQYSISNVQIEEPDDALKIIFAELAEKLLSEP